MRRLQPKINCKDDKPDLVIVVADSFAGDRYLHPNFISKFPNATFFHHTHPDSPRKKKPDAHGGLVASCLIPPLHDAKIHVHLIRWIDVQTSQAPMFILDVAEKVGADIINNSWGQRATTSSRTNSYIAGSWKAFRSREASLRKETGHLMVASLGNTDTRGLSTRDQGFPWRGMTGVVNVGSHDRQGRVTEWSSDATDHRGRNPKWKNRATCSAIGERRWLVNPFNGRFQAGSGTSFSGPFVAGTLGALRLAGELQSFNYDEIMDYLTLHLKLPPGVRRYDPKYGCGSIEKMGQGFAREGFMMAGFPGSHDLAISRVQWLDGTKIPS